MSSLTPPPAQAKRGGTLWRLNATPWRHAFRAFHIPPAGLLVLEYADASRPTARPPGTIQSPLSPLPHPPTVCITTRHAEEAPAAALGPTFERAPLEASNLLRDGSFGQDLTNRPRRAVRPVKRAF